MHFYAKDGKMIIIVARGIITHVLKSNMAKHLCPVHFCFWLDSANINIASENDRIVWCDSQRIWCLSEFATGIYVRMIATNFLWSFIHPQIY